MLQISEISQKFIFLKNQFRYHKIKTILFLMKILIKMLIVIVLIVNLIICILNIKIFFKKNKIFQNI